MLSVFIYGKFSASNNDVPKLNTRKKVIAYALAKSAITGLIVFESLFIYFKTGNFNDDVAPRPFLHGAYQVEFFIKDSDTLPPLLTDNLMFKRIFMHRQGYFIIQNMNDELQDYKLRIAGSTLWLTPPAGKPFYFTFNYSPGDSLLTLSGTYRQHLVNIQARQINQYALPLFKGGFNWVVQ